MRSVASTEKASSPVARRERNWQRKYAPVMRSTPELQRLRNAIEALTTEAIQEMERHWGGPSTQELERRREAGRNAMSIYGIHRSHDVMFLAHYAKTMPGSAAWNAIAYAGLAVGALPFGLDRRDYLRLVSTLAQHVPWLNDL